MAKFRDWEDHIRSKIHDYIENNRGFIMNSKLCPQIYEYLRELLGDDSFNGNDLPDLGIQRVIDVVFAFDEEFSWRKVNQFDYRIEAKSIDLKQTSVNWLRSYLKSNGETSMGPLGSSYYAYMHQFCSRIRLENTLQFNSLFDFIKQFPSNMFHWKQCGSSVSISLPKPYILITSDTEAMAIKDELLNNTKFFIDCEWDRDERICLMQILPYNSTKPYIFDLYNMNNRLRTYVKYYIFNEIFESNVTKIFHDHTNDMRVIQSKFGYNVDDSTIYDTQMKFTKNKIGLNEALTTMGINEQKSPLNVDYRRNPNFWRQRPLTEEMLTYAANDVILLKKLYDALQQYIKKRNEEEEKRKLIEKKRMEDEKRESALERKRQEYQEKERRAMLYNKMTYFNHSSDESEYGDEDEDYEDEDDDPTKCGTCRRINCVLYVDDSSGLVVCSKCLEVMSDGNPYIPRMFRRVARLNMYR